MSTKHKNKFRDKSKIESNNANFFTKYDEEISLSYPCVGTFDIPI